MLLIGGSYKRDGPQVKISYHWLSAHYANIHSECHTDTVSRSCLLRFATEPFCAPYRIQRKHIHTPVCMYRLRSCHFWSCRFDHFQYEHFREIISATAIAAPAYRLWFRLEHGVCQPPPTELNTFHFPRYSQTLSHRWWFFFFFLFPSRYSHL